VDGSQVHAKKERSAPRLNRPFEPRAQEPIIDSGAGESAGRYWGRFCLPASFFWPCGDRPNRVPGWSAVERKNHAYHPAGFRRRWTPPPPSRLPLRRAPAKEPGLTADDGAPTAVPAPPGRAIHIGVPGLGLSRGDYWCATILEAESGELD
jgi:hypothetical protein